VGIYVPAAGRPFRLSVLMNAIPAKVAGVREIVMVTPADKESEQCVMAAAKLSAVWTG
jgi:histidinol dehydrogenase